MYDITFNANRSFTITTVSGGPAEVFMTDSIESLAATSREDLINGAAATWGVTVTFASGRELQLRIASIQRVNGSASTLTDNLAGTANLIDLIQSERTAA